MSYHCRFDCWAEVSIRTNFRFMKSDIAELVAHFVYQRWWQQSRDDETKQVWGTGFNPPSGVQGQRLDKGSGGRSPPEAESLLQNCSVVCMVLMQYSFIGLVNWKKLIVSYWWWGFVQYDMTCYFNVRSRADMSQLNLPHRSFIYRTEHNWLTTRKVGAASTIVYCPIFQYWAAVATHPNRMSPHIPVCPGLPRLASTRKAKPRLAGTRKVKPI